MDITALTGILGAGIILIAFIMNQLDKWDSETIQYDVVNFIGSVLLVLYAYQSQTWPFFILNSVWALFSAIGVVSYLRKK